MHRDIEQRNIALWIVLTVVTCGIAGFVWLYYINEDMQKIADDDFNMGSGSVVLLALICNIFTCYWAYKMGSRLDLFHRNMNGSKNILYLVLCILGLNIITFALIQDELNSISMIPDDFYGYNDPGKDQNGYYGNSGYGDRYDGDDRNR